MKMRQVAISSSLISDRSGRQSVFLNVECWAGRLAQLVEHRLYTPAVRGSSPLPPIKIFRINRLSVHPMPRASAFEQITDDRHIRHVPQIRPLSPRLEPKNRSRL